MTRVNRGQRYLVAGALLAGGLLSALTQPAQAQTTQLDARWQGWLGCWAPVGAPAASPSGTATAQLRCVVPASSTSGVDIATIENGKVISRERVVATGERIPATEGECTGWESAQWSAEGRRVYLRSEYDCSGGKGGLLQTSNGVLAMSPSGDWLDVRGVKVGEGTGVHVTRYRAAPVPATLPSALASALQTNELSVRAARTAATAPLTTTDVMEASTYLDATVLQSWLIAQHEGFKLDADQLVTLADAGVPTPVIDAMVALSYPKEFAINPGPGDGDLGLNEASSNERTGARSVVVLDPYGYSPYGYYSPFGYSPFGYSSFGYSPYGYGYGLGYGWYGGGSPVIIVRNSDVDNNVPIRSHGTVVKGQGYVPGAGASSTGRHATPRARSGSTSRSSGRTARPAVRTTRPATRTAQPRKSSGSSGAHPSTTRTAKPRHPDGNH